MDNQLQRKAKLESKESQQLKIPQNNIFNFLHILAVFILRRINRLRQLVRLKNFSVRQYKCGTKPLVDGIVLSFHRLNSCDDKTMRKLEKLCRQN